MKDSDSVINNIKTFAYNSVALFVAASLVQIPLLAQETGSKAGFDELEHISIFGSRQTLETSTGSGFIVDAEQLENFEFDDIHRILQTAPGVYIREEDGYGLRPNIGLRGATAERSSKIALMEDGVLLTPAPYSAPAAYFFPNVSRMTQVEIFKGPSAIQYGPNTVGGAINMVSRSISDKDEGTLDLAGGQQGYQKAHAYYSKRVGEFGALVEGLSISADGFKDLPDGSDTGFEKREFVGKLSYTPENDNYNQHFEFKFGYADEESNETYVGLTDEDFAVTPYRRYAASQNDEFDSKHSQLQLYHYADLNANISLFTQAYRRDYDRDWDRLNGFDTNRSISSILRSPATGLNALFYQVLTGERYSIGNDESLVFLLNDREYYSQGVQSKIEYDSRWRDYDLIIDAGFRIHQDQVKRNHRERFLRMQGGNLVRSNSPDQLQTQNQDEVTALAGFTNVRITDDKLNASVGFRVENIDGESIDYLTNTTLDNSDTVFLPGAGVFYQLTSHLGLLAGVNKGYVPNSPGQATNIDPEESWNYELGVRSNFQVGVVSL